jgi:hypothetical protein
VYIAEADLALRDGVALPEDGVCNLHGEPPPRGSCYVRPLVARPRRCPEVIAQLAEGALARLAPEPRSRAHAPGGNTALDSRVATKLTIPGLMLPHIPVDMAQSLAILSV